MTRGNSFGHPSSSLWAAPASLSHLRVNIPPPHQPPSLSAGSPQIGLSLIASSSDSKLNLGIANTPLTAMLSRKPSAEFSG